MLESGDLRGKLLINDFQISMDKISMRGSVSSMDTVYGNGGLLDIFNKL